MLMGKLFSIFYLFVAVPAFSEVSPTGGPATAKRQNGNSQRGEENGCPDLFDFGGYCRDSQNAI
jgi:hypothetical protein